MPYVPLGTSRNKFIWGGLKVHTDSKIAKITIDISDKLTDSFVAVGLFFIAMAVKKNTITTAIKKRAIKVPSVLEGINEGMFFPYKKYS